MAGVIFGLAPTLASVGFGLLSAYKLHASGESPLYRLVGKLGMPWWTGPPMLAALLVSAGKLVCRYAPTGALHMGLKELAEAMSGPVALGMLTGWAMGALVGDASAFGLQASYLLVLLAALLCEPCAVLWCGSCLVNSRSRRSGGEARLMMPV